MPPPVLLIVIAWPGDWPMTALKPIVAGVVARIGVVGCPMEKVMGKVWVPVVDLKKMDPP